MNKKVINMLLLFILLCISSFILSGCSNNNDSNINTKNIEGYAMTSSELLDVFKNEGYTIKIEQFISSKYSDKSVHILLENPKKRNHNRKNS